MLSDSAVAAFSDTVPDFLSLVSEEVRRTMCRLRCCPEDRNAADVMKIASQGQKVLKLTK